MYLRVPHPCRVRVGSDDLKPKALRSSFNYFPVFSSSANLSDLCVSALSFLFFFFFSFLLSLFSLSHSFRHNTNDVPDTLLITGASQLLTLRGTTPAPRRFPFRSRRHQRWGPPLEQRRDPRCRPAQENRIYPRRPARGKARPRWPRRPARLRRFPHSPDPRRQPRRGIRAENPGCQLRRDRPQGRRHSQFRAKTPRRYVQALKNPRSSRPQEFASYGTTTIEAKSGYGLDVASRTENPSLHKELSADQPLEIVSTFLGAHVVPPEFRLPKTGHDQVYPSSRRPTPP